MWAGLLLNQHLPVASTPPQFLPYAFALPEMRRIIRSRGETALNKKIACWLTPALLLHAAGLYYYGGDINVTDLNGVGGPYCCSSRRTSPGRSCFLPVMFNFDRVLRSTEGARGADLDEILTAAAAGQSLCQTTPHAMVGASAPSGLALISRRWDMCPRTVPLAIATRATALIL